MLGRSWVAVAALAFLYGSSAAPYTHAHHAIDSVSDEHHPQGDSLVHTHASPHAHHDGDDSQPEPGGAEDNDDQIWSVDSFVFPQPVPSPAPAPVLVVFSALHDHRTSTWSGVERPEPTAHGPPVGSPSGLRAPPAFLPSFA